MKGSTSSLVLLGRHAEPRLSRQRPKAGDISRTKLVSGYDVMTTVIYSIFIYLNMSSMFLVSEILTLAACIGDR